MPPSPAGTVAAASTVWSTACSPVVAPSHSGLEGSSAFSLSSAPSSYTVSPAMLPVFGAAAGSSSSHGGHGGHCSHGSSSSISSNSNRTLDHEASEALLLLNTDRRRSMTRGMSVKDLLST
jgi:hypothetical protein